MGGNTGPDVDAFGVALLLRLSFPSSSPVCLDLILRFCVVLMRDLRPMVPQT